MLKNESSNMLIQPPKYYFGVACLIIAQRVSLFYCSSSMQSQGKKKQGQMAKLRRFFLDVC